MQQSWKYQAWYGQNRTLGIKVLVVDGQILCFDQLLGFNNIIKLCDGGGGGAEKQQ